MKNLIIIIVLFLGVKSIGQSSQQQPNIIFLLTDDQRDNTFGIDGHPWVKTPNIDKLIKNGVRFSNTYIAEPTCAPSRVSFFTGMRERVNGVGFSSSYQLTDKQWEQTYPAQLKNNGYYTGFIGKFGVEFYTFKGKASQKFDYWRGHDGWARFFPKTARNCEAYYDSKEEIVTPIMGESMERFLDTIPDNKPFCLSVSFSIPHGSQIVSMNPRSPDAGSLLEPANDNPRLKGSPFYDTLYRDFAVEIPEETATDPYVFIPQAVLDQSKGRATRTYKYDYKKESVKEHHIRYYQQISGMDKEVGDLVKSLKRRGLSDNTIIIFASDHGLLIGEYGMGGKGLLYDLTSKIPCFVYDPRLSSTLKGRTLDELVSSLDITSTILEYANVTIPKEMEGKSLIPLILGKKQSWRKEIFLENLYTGRDNPFSEGVRYGKWKYIRMFDGIEPFNEKNIDFEGSKPDFEQLFNLEEDPGEKTNLISQYARTKLLNDLRKKCQKYSTDLNIKRAEYSKTHEIVKR